jgi:hypothetical protein
VVGGLERFRDHFRDHTHQYALIGGSACDLLMEQVGLTFRATKDLDIVLIVEELDSAFARSFWDFIRAGRYGVAQSRTGKPLNYRFVSPQATDFPSMLEVLSNRPDQIPFSDGVHLTPIPFDGEISSLSAILLREDYYEFLKAGIRIIEGVSVVGPEHLVPLKTRAWLDLKERRAAGHDIHSSDINKHRKDVFRLYRIVDPAPLKDTPQAIREDMRRFLTEVRSEPIDLKGLGIARSSLDEVLDQLGRIYGAG